MVAVVVILLLLTVGAIGAGVYYSRSGDSATQERLGRFVGERREGRAGHAAVAGQGAVQVRERADLFALGLGEALRDLRHLLVLEHVELGPQLVVADAGHRDDVGHRKGEGLGVRG